WEIGARPVPFTKITFPGVPLTEGQVPTTSLIAYPAPVEARVQNGIWTRVDQVTDGKDVAVKDDLVWVLNGDWSIWIVDSLTARTKTLKPPFVVDQGSVDWPRISASRNPIDSSGNAAWIPSSPGARVIFSYEKYA